MEDVVKVTKNGNQFDFQFKGEGMPMWNKRSNMSVSHIMCQVADMFNLVAMDRALPGEAYTDIQVFFPLAPTILVLTSDRSAHAALLDCIEHALDTWPDG